MKPAPFDYVAPASLAEAIDLLAAHGEEAKLLAGGQSLVPLMAFRLATPTLLVDLNGISGLGEIIVDGDAVTIGALTRHRDVETHAQLGGRCDLLSEAVARIGHVAIRNRGTVGGSVAHADPAAEWPAIVTALDGDVEAVGPNGARTLSPDEMFVSYFTTALESIEIVTKVRLRLPSARSGSAFVELARRHGDFAIVGVGAVLDLSEDGSISSARVALIGVGERVVRSRSAEAVMSGRRPTNDVLATAAGYVSEDISPSSDVHASAAYRRSMAQELTRRALSLAAKRARKRVDGGD